MLVTPRELSMVIEGARLGSATGRRFETVDPTHGTVWATLPDAGADDVDRAVTAARRAFGPWAGLTASERGAPLFRVADLVDEHAETFAEIETRENGKLLRETRGQLGSLSKWYRFYGGRADKIDGRVPPIDFPTVFSYVLREPVGVVAAIVPWNSPLLLTTCKLAPALAAGNTVVVKPSEVASASVVELASLLPQAGIPEDADPVAAAAGALAGIFAASGQTCIAGSRVLVHRSLYDGFLETLVERAGQIRVGDPLDAETQMGPLATLAHLERVEGFVEQAVAGGASVAVGGRRPDDDSLPGGFFFEPTILVDVSPSALIAQEEIFGPVLVVLPFEDEEEAVVIANGTRYSLAAGIWTKDVKRAHRLARRLVAGTVWVNMYRAMSPLVPHGGSGLSGHGRENGLEALEEFTKAKAVWLELGDGIQDPFVGRTK